MATIKLMFFDWDTFFGNAIKRLTECDWGAHIGVIVSESPACYIVAESVPSKGVTLTNYSKEWYNNAFKAKTALVVDTNIPQPQGIDMVAVARSFLGLKYDWLAIVKNLLQIMFGRRRWLVKSSGYVICSEFVVRYLAKIGAIDLEKELDEDADVVSPADIYNYFNGEN